MLSDAPPGTALRLLLAYSSGGLMQIHIGCTDGHTYKSDNFTEGDLAEHLPLKGWGSWADKTANTVDEALEMLVGMAVYDDSYNRQTLSIQVGGNERNFN